MIKFIRKVLGLDVPEVSESVTDESERERLLTSDEGIASDVAEVMRNLALKVKADTRRERRDKKLAANYQKSITNNPTIGKD